MAMIEIKNLTKKYGDKVLFDNFSYTFPENKITVILGESGSGKTTLLNMMLNITDYSGEISGVNKPSVVFQKDRLIKNLTVKQNLEFINKDICVTAELKKVNMEGEENSYIKNLSAGMARRLAIIRALTYKSDILLMDEPFINLDLALKYSLMDTVKKTCENKTAIIVTHDIKEAVYLADEIVVLKNGNFIHKISQKNDKTEKELFDLMMNLK